MTKTNEHNTNFFFIYQCNLQMKHSTYIINGTSFML